MKRKKSLLLLISILLVLAIVIVASACDNSSEDLPSGVPSGDITSGDIASGDIPSGELPSGTPTIPPSGDENGDTPSAQTHQVSLQIGEDEESIAVKNGSTIADLLAQSDLYANASNNKWLHYVKDKDGNTYQLEDMIDNDIALEVTMESAFGYHVYLQEATGVNIQGMSNSSYTYNPFFRIMGNTIDVIERDVVNDCLVATIGDAQATIGTVKGYYYDAEYTQPIGYGEELSLAANEWKSIYVKITWTTAPRTLGANINLSLFDGEDIVVDAKANSVTTITSLLSPTATSALVKSGNYAKVEYGANNQISKVAITRNNAVTEYNASESDSYYVSYGDSILTGLSNASIVGNITFERSGQSVTAHYTEPSIDIKHINRGEFSESLENGLKSYLNSDAFAKLISTQASANRMTFSYLKYIDYNFYNEDLVQTAFKDLVLDKIKTIIKDGEIDDALWYDSTVKTQGWYGYFDFFNTWAYTYQQYNDYLYKSGKSENDNEYKTYLPMIQKYYEKWIPLIMTDGLYQNAYDVYSVINNWAKIGQEGYAQTVGEAIDNIQSKLDLIDGKYEDSVFVENLQWLKDNLYRLRFTDAVGAITMFKSKAQGMYSAIRLGASFGFNYMQLWLLVYENLGFDIKNSQGMKLVIASFEKMYYELKEDGTYKESTGCNWVGWSGAPIVRSVLAKYSGQYNVEYEKSQQAYFPYQDKGMTQQGLSAMINLDRLYDFYNHTLTTGSNVSPEYALLTMYMHGIDPEHYKKGVETANVDNEYNIIERWVEKLGYDADGNVVISNTLDMAIAICYLVKSKGIDAPALWGVVDGSEAVITL